MNRGRCSTCWRPLTWTQWNRGDKRCADCTLPPIHSPKFVFRRASRGGGDD